MRITTGARRRLHKEVVRRLAAVDDEQATNAAGEWLRLRAWVAWRLVLAQGLGRSSRHILHGPDRDQLCEQLLEASTGRQQVISRARNDLAALRRKQRFAWRRWLRAGGWAAFNLDLGRAARLCRNRALMAQREGMRRWACMADGTTWCILTEAETEERFELRHDGLRDLLATKQVLTQGRVAGVGDSRPPNWALRQGRPVLLWTGAGPLLSHVEWAGGDGRGRGRAD